MKCLVRCNNHFLSKGLLLLVGDVQNAVFIFELFVDVLHALFCNRMSFTDVRNSSTHKEVVGLFALLVLAYLFFDPLLH